MKTKSLREHLLDRSRTAAVETGLAAMRARVLAAAVETPQPRPGALDVMRMFWRELILPCRGLWATLAAAWVAVLFFGATARPLGGEVGRPRAGDLAAWVGAWHEQQRLLAELRGHHAKPGPDASIHEAAETASPKPLGWRGGARPQNSATLCA